MGEVGVGLPKLKRLPVTVVNLVYDKVHGVKDFMSCYK
ncbi:uncharacterized protein G2W53_018611 [Senna tora]|uniref:Uncharacterized protein n=1 Tax=Senna tora TaxID=362788 RepID=A0A834TSS5_9FABA|nr:uncharacterized protein G2W53_018611 [Senna tora]